MKVIENKYLPLHGFKAMNLFGLFLFVRKGAKMSSEDMNHEEIHSAQWKELWYVLFYLWYIVDWLVKLVIYRNFRDAYVNVVFEREAYANDEDEDYLKTRKLFAFIRYL